MAALQNRPSGPLSASLTLTQKPGKRGGSSRNQKAEVSRLLSAWVVSRDYCFHTARSAATILESLCSPPCFLGCRSVIAFASLGTFPTPPIAPYRKLNSVLSAAVLRDDLAAALPTGFPICAASQNLPAN